MGMADKFRQKAEQLQHEAGKRMGGRGEKSGKGADKANDRREGEGDDRGDDKGERSRRSEPDEQAAEQGRSQHGGEQRRGGAGEMADRARDETKNRFEH